MPTPDASPSAALNAWGELCARLGELGAEVFGPDYANADSVEMLTHVADQTANWLSWYVFYADPTRPAWHRQQDHVGRYGGPNADNSYRYTRLDPSRRYRIAGHMHGCDDWLMTLRTGFMAEHGTTLADITASDLGIGRGEPFEIFLGGPDGIPIPEGVIMATVREYYLEWSEDEPATFTIECLDAPELPLAVTADVLAERLQTTRAAIDHSIVYWNRYMDEGRASGPLNQFLPSHHGAKGLQLAQYLHLYWELDRGETIVVDTDLPAARYWSFELYPMGTFEHLDLHDRITSLNQSQIDIDDDGRVQVAVGGVDPGWHNWLDTGGRQKGMLIFRWFWPTATTDPRPPEPTTRVVEANSLTGPVTAQQRKTMMEARRRHLAWRFRE